MRLPMSWLDGHRPGRPSRRLISSLVAVPILVSLAACTGGGAPAAPSQPTVQAAATQVSAAVSPVAATAQALAPTAQAAASPAVGVAQSVAGTAVAAASPLATALASPSPSPAAQAPVRITDASLADATPWVSLHNDGSAPVDVGGWQLTVGTQTAALPEGATIQPGETLTLHTGDGVSSDREIYLGTSGEALASAAQPGTTVRLTDDGQVVAQTTVPRVL